MSQQRYALWYEPTGESYVELSAIIKKLATAYRSPIFEPHITLLPGGTEANLATVTQKLEDIISDTPPFETHLTSYSYLEEYFKCIFIQVEKTPSVMNFAHAIQREIHGQQANDFIPHLSIFYGQLPIAEKKEIIKNLGDLVNKHFIIKTVHVISYELGKPPESWKKVASIIFSKTAV
ncbi:2'-5' RNA ligase family protein [Candidatus Gottesmanbacteria bacterium]|nr:2'-5' RNA ligase family protein [Candidatus Gottesmanbacteria bacterium]